MPRFGDAGGGIGAGFFAGGRRHQGGGFTGDGQVQVDAVEQGAGEFVAVALDLVATAAAATTGFTEISTGAGVHCRHQLKACGKAHLIAGAGNDDLAGLEW
ncbi:hypothetical protein D3C75_1172300 [compost metagenome]